MPAETVTFGDKFGPSGSGSVAVGSTADVLSSIARESPVNVQDDESEIVDHADPGTGSQRSAIVEPFNAHRSVSNGFDAAVEMSRCAFYQVQVFDFSDEFRRIGFLIFSSDRVLTFPQTLFQFLDAFRSRLKINFKFKFYPKRAAQSQRQTLKLCGS